MLTVFGQSVCFFIERILLWGYISVKSYMIEGIPYDAFFKPNMVDNCRSVSTFNHSAATI